MQYWKTFIRYLIFGTCFLFVKSISSIAQFNYINNGTLYNKFVGQSIFPNGWTACDDFSNPDMYSFYVPYPAGSGDTIFPVNGSTFLFMRTRGKYHINDPGPYTYEYITEKLKQPLEKDSTYMFDFFYRFNSHLLYEDLITPNIAYPVRLELWVGHDSCANEKLLMQTEPLQDTVWTERHCTFTLKDTSYAYIRVTTNWDSMTMNSTHESYNGMILLDSISIIKLSGIGNPIDTFDIYYKGTGKTTLNASYGTSYTWLPHENLSAYNIKSPTMYAYTSKYYVAEGSLSTCSILEAFNIILNCDSLYPNFYKDSSELYYNPHRIEYLHSTLGTKYLWTPGYFLSDSITCCPVIESYNKYFVAKIWDENNCPYNELFKLLINCDTIVINKTIISLDTTVEMHPHILLIPSYGEVDSSWTPSTWLSCINCPEPYTEPYNAINYKIKLIDKYGCIHYEKFNINFELFVPNVITPNGDGFNDCFSITGLPENSTVKIFSKNGIMVYSASPYNDSDCWNGTDRNGRILDTGTYWYIIENSGKGLYLKGFLLVLK
jgi:gliding motility-associated-like protein